MIEAFFVYKKYSHSEIMQVITDGEKKSILKNHQGSIYSYNVLSHLNYSVCLSTYVYDSCNSNRETLRTGAFLEPFTIQI